MTIFEIIILALALSLDAMIVCFSYGLILNANKVKNSLTLSLSFGFFQFLMPVIGFYLSAIVYNQLKSFSKWIVFAVFVYLALKFLKSAFGEKEETCRSCVSFLCLLGLSVATSIDALGAGISIKFSGEEILKPAVCTGVITFLCSMAGFWFACLFKKFPTKYIEITGAVLLLYLAVSSII